MDALTELSLFSGAGGGLRATHHLLGWKTVCYVEWEKYVIEVLKARIRDGYLDDAPIWDDAFTFDGSPWAGLVDVVTAGFPCQPFSSAGKGLAENDPRNGWPAVIRILREVRPHYALLENVPGLISKPYFRRILGDLAEAGFDIEQDCISAAEIGANHKRERLWFVAHAKSSKRDIPAIAGKSEEKIHPPWDGAPQPLADAESSEQDRIGAESGWTQNGFTNSSEKMADPNSGRLRKFEASRVTGDAGQSTRSLDEERGVGWWTVEPDVGRVADGVASRVDRLTALGNGQVPAVVREAWNRLGASR